MVVAVFVMTMAIAQGFRGALVASGSNENAILLRKGATSETVSGVLAAAAAADRGDAAGRARRRRPCRSRRPNWSSSSRCRGVSDNQPGERAGARRRADGIRDPQHAEVRRRPPLHAGHPRNQRRPSGGRPLPRCSRYGSEVKFGAADLEGRRHLHRRRRVVRVGSVGRRRSDDAGVPAQRLSVDRR